MNAKHVDGPWEAETDTGCVVLGDMSPPDARVVVASVQRYCVSLGAARAEAEATLHLVAAAPELLEALKAQAYTKNSTPESGPCCWCDPTGDSAEHDEPCRQARAALAKAEGGVK